MRRKQLFACTGLILAIVMLAVQAARATNQIAVRNAVASGPHIADSNWQSAIDNRQSESAGVTDALKASFGSAVEAVTGFQPFYVTGDFNGDAMADIVIAVRIKERRTALPKDVRLLNPFYGSPKVTYPSNPASQNTMALAIIHSWKSPQPAAKFLLIGEGPILIFVYDRTSDPSGAKYLMDVRRKRAKRRPGELFPPTAKGDVIQLATQVGDYSELYWNGRTYRWEEGAAD